MSRSSGHEDAGVSGVGAIGENLIAVEHTVEVEESMVVELFIRAHFGILAVDDLDRDCENMSTVALKNSVQPYLLSRLLRHTHQPELRGRRPHPRPVWGK